MTPLISKMVRRVIARTSNANRSHRNRRPRLNVQNLEDRAVPAIFTVTNTDDTGVGSLHQAIDDANSAGTDDEIVFDTAGIFGSPQTIALASALPQLADNGSLTITGTGSSNLTIDAGGNFRVFDSFNSNPKSDLVLVP